MTYICQKCATFAGRKYMPGDEVPAEAIAPGRIGAMIGMGLIAESKQSPTDPMQEPAPMTVPIVLKDGTVENLEVTEAAVQEAVAVFQMNAENAAAHIAEMTDNAALIIIDACDSRKTIKTATASRAKALEEAAAADPEQSDEDAAPPEQEGQGADKSAE